MREGVLLFGVSRSSVGLAEALGVGSRLPGGWTGEVREGSFSWVSEEHVGNRWGLAGTRWGEPSAPRPAARYSSQSAHPPHRREATLVESPESGEVGAPGTQAGAPTPSLTLIPERSILVLCIALSIWLPMRRQSPGPPRDHGAEAFASIASRPT